MSRDSARALDVLQQLGDLVLAAGVFVAVVSLASPSAASLPSLLPLGLVATLVWPGMLRRVDTGGERDGPSAELRRLVLAACVAIVAESAAAFLTRAPVPRWLPLVCGGLQLAAIGLLHAGVLGLREAWQPTGPERRNVLIAGSGPRAAYVQAVIERHPGWGLNVVGFVDDPEGDHRFEVPRELVFGQAHMDELLRDQVIDEIVVACPRSKLDAFLPVVDRATAAGVPITLLSDIFGDLLPAPRVKRFGTLPALSFAPVHHEPTGLALKRVLDVAGASLGLLLTAPLLLLAAAAIKLSSPGPVLFRQVRCSLNGRTFVMPKLRTMVADSEARRLALDACNEMDGPVFKIRDDPRVTMVGRFLRRYSLDELPQLWSVLRGDMSLVGPRPPMPTEVAAYRTFERRRLSMRPGLTCLWQVSGRNDIGFEDWVRMDLEYIDTWSLSGDLRILARTVPAVLSGTGAS